MFEKYVRGDINGFIALRNSFTFVSSDGNHFNENWLQKIRIDAGDNYRIKVK